MVIIVITVLMMAACFVGAATAQDAQTVSALMGVGGGVGGVGGVTGVTSLIQSNRVSKNIDETHEELKVLHSKLNRAIEANIAQVGEKNTLGEQVATFQATARSDMSRVNEKLDRMQGEIHAIALDFARLPQNTRQHSRQNQEDDTL